MNKLAVLLGAGRGMAFEAARALGHHGYRVVLTDLDGERAATAERRLCAEGIEATGTRVDSADGSELGDFARRIGGPSGVNVLISAVGGSAGTPRWIEEIEPEHVSAVMRLCAGSALNAAEEFREALMRAEGSAVFVSSSAARLGDRAGWSPVYAMGKGAVIGLVRYFSSAPAWYGVRVNAVCPGDVLTERTLEIFAEDGWSPDEQDVILHRRNSLGRIASPEELGHTIANLATDTFTSGVILDVCGGEYPTIA